MSVLQELVSKIPFLSGYNAEEDRTRAANAQGLQQVQQFMTLQGAMEDRAARQAEAPIKAELLREQIKQARRLAGQGQAISTGLRMPDGTIVAPPEKKEPPTEVARLIAERNALPEGDPRRVLYDRVLSKKTETTERNSNLQRLLTEKASLPPGDPQHSIYDNAIRKESETAKQISPTVVMPPAVTISTIVDPNNQNQSIVIDARIYRGGSLGSVGVLGIAPKLTETGRANFKQMTNMQGLGADLQKAEDLLLGNVRDSEGNVTKGSKPTNSGLGSLVDSAAGFIGVTPSGAAEADALKVVSGRLVQKVPRFEGPQSEKDVALYKEMAGDAGNEKKPFERRLAAIRTMREIYSGYESGERGRLVQDDLSGSPAPKPSGGNKPSPSPKPARRASDAPSGMDAKVWGAMTPEEKALFK